VNDKEDGSLADGKISPEQVSVRIDYLEEGFDKIEIAQGHLSADAFAKHASGKKLMEGSDCKACHSIDRKSVGPMYSEVARKYKDDPKAVDYLAKKIIGGGSGVWGETSMSAHPQLPMADATEIVKYILSLGSQEEVKSFPPRGSYTTKIDKDMSDKGVLIIRAAYTDKGANGIQPATTEKVLTLTSPNFEANKAEKMDGVRKAGNSNPRMIGTRNNAYIGFNQLDLTGVTGARCIVFAPEERLNAAGGSIEVRIDAPDGPIVGQSKPIAVVKGKQPGPVPITTSFKISPTQGFHDLYFIFKNEKAAADQPLFILSDIKLESDPKMFKENAITMK
jgi:cytochrome c